jgi:hypothetical protein
MTGRLRKLAVIARPWTSEDKCIGAVFSHRVAGIFLQAARSIVK